jgi:hypothetical protein
MSRKSNLPKIIAALELAPAGLTQTELRRITGASLGTVHTYVHQLHDAGRTHIASWKTDQAGKGGGGVYQARYKLGPGQDKPKPPPLTPSQIAKRARARARQSGELAELRARIAEAERRRYWRNKPARRDVLTAAFFGG